MDWIIQRLSSLRSRSPVGAAQLWIVRPHYTLMKISKSILVAAALTLFATHSASAQGYVSFDSADSDFAAGDYYFILSGITEEMGGYTLSGLTLSGFSAVGDTQALVAVSSPSGWLSTGSDTDALQYQAELLFSDSILNGRLEVSATPNLSGSIDWLFTGSTVGSFPGNGSQTAASGIVTIESVPEPTSFALFSIAVVSLFGIRCLSMTMWPNTALEPTPTAP
jgi:hypothetical protein